MRWLPVIMGMILLTVSALPMLLHVSAVQVDTSPALYVVENVSDPVEGVVNIRNLVRLSLDCDNQLIREVILSLDQRFFGHFGGHRIALERFVVTCYGGVIDIPSKKVIHNEQDGELLGLDDGKVIYRVNDHRGKNEVFYFDLKERKLGKVEKESHWYLPGVKSPDKTMSVQQDRDSVLRLHQLGKAPKELGKDFTITLCPGSSALPRVPCLWLDNKRIITVQTNRKLVIITTDGVTEQFIEVKDAPAEVVGLPQLWLDKQGKVIYSCGGEHFWIDVHTKAASPLQRYSLGNGFEASVAVDQKQRRTVYHNGKEIGQWVFSPFDAETMPGRIGFAYVQPGEHANLGYPDGVAVWDARIGDWRVIVGTWVNNIIGWSK